MQSLACNVFLSDLTLEFDAVGVVLGHGFHPWKARRPRSIPNPRPVHRHGRTPLAQSAMAKVRTLSGKPDERFAKSAKSLLEISAEFSPCSTVAVSPYLAITRAYIDKL